MKKYIALLIGCSIFLNSCNSSQLNDNKYHLARLILVLYEGNHFYDLIIGSDKSKVDSLYDNSLSSITDSVDKSFEVHKHFLSDSAVVFILRYLRNNGNKRIGIVSPKGQSFYYITIFPDNKGIDTIKCYVPNDERGTYFNGLINYINASIYKDECKYLVNDLRAKFLNLRAFPFTPEQEELMREKGAMK